MAKVTPFDVDADTGNPQHMMNEVRRAFESLLTILTNLSFADNFRAFIWEGTIAANSNKTIPNNLNRIPTGYLVIKKKGGTIEDGDTTWTKDNLYIKNAHATDSTTVKILFFI